MTEQAPADDAQTTPPQALLLLGYFLAAFYFFYAFVQRVTPGIMVDDLMRDFAVGGALLGNLSAFYFYAYASIQMAVGVLMDRIGPRRLMAAACLTAALGSLIFSLADSLALAYAGRLLIGFGSAFAWVGLLTFSATWFPPRRFALLTGGGQLLGVAGGIFGQVPLQLAVAALGWRASSMALAGLGLVLCVLILLVVRDRPQSDAESESGQRSILAGLSHTGRNLQTWLAAVHGFGMTGTMLVFGGLWGVPFLRSVHGLEPIMAAGVNSWLFIGWGIGAVTVGWLSDHLGNRLRLMFVGALLATICAASVLYLPSPGPSILAVLLCLQGVGSSSMVLCFAFGREHNPSWASGATLGLINMFVTGSGAVLQPLVGWLLDQNWNGVLLDGARVYDAAAYQNALLILPIAALIGCIAAVFSKETYCRPQA